MPKTARQSFPAKQVKLFRNGRSQAVRIPKEFELPGDSAVLRREGGRLVLEPVPLSSLGDYLATLQPIDEDVGEIADPPPRPVTL